jgi:hypothetical protein
MSAYINTQKDLKSNAASQTPRKTRTAKPKTSRREITKTNRQNGDQKTHTKNRQNKNLVL